MDLFPICQNETKSSQDCENSYGSFSKIKILWSLRCLVTPGEGIKKNRDN